MTSATMTCPRCQGEIEYDVESVDSGDGPWAQSGWVGYVLWDEVRLVDPLPEKNARTGCGCTWTYDEIEHLDEQATKRAAEGPSEP